MSWTLFYGVATAVVIGTWGVTMSRFPLWWIGEPRMSPQPSRMQRSLLGASAIATPIVIVGLLSSIGILDPILFPPPHQVLEKVIWLCTSGIIFPHVSASCLRVIIGFFPTALIATGIGAIAAASLPLRHIVMPPASVLRYVPPTVFVSVLILWFGVGELPKLFLIAIGVFFFIIQMTLDAFISVPSRYLETARSFGYSRPALIIQVLVPAALPRIIDTWRINFAASWPLLVIAELINADVGFGALLSSSARYLRMVDFYAVVLIISAVGFLADQAFQWVRPNWPPAV
jgi:ABC-type nitrate/sulfonate/bicarbonate transport system permease component